MMRRTIAASIAAWLGACLLFGTLALAPDDAAAWTINQPRFEKQVVTEGDPDSPGVNAPLPGVEVNAEDEWTEQGVVSALLQIVDVISDIASF